jgi:hypothetical protein
MQVVGAGIPTFAQVMQFVIIDVQMLQLKKTGSK